MSGPPAPFVRRFHDLARVVDDVHAVFDGWVEGNAFAGALDQFGLLVMKLAVHEWIANLVQHASFGGRLPEITLTVRPERGGLHCAIEDNSDGFDFRGQVTAQAETVNGEAPPERGRGLLMLLACTEELAYEGADGGSQRLAFVIRLPVAPESLADLFPDEGGSDEGGPDDGHPAEDALARDGDLSEPTA